MKTLRLVFLSLLAIFFLLSCAPTPLPFPTRSHGIESIHALNKLWMLNDVYISQNSFSALTGATEGKYCFLGNLSNQAESKIICLDSLTGKMLWNASIISSPTAFAISPKGIFIGTSGIPAIARYNLDGKFIWDTSFTGNGVMHIYAVNNEIQVFNHPNKLRVFNAETGDLARTVTGDTIYISTKTEEFIYINNLQLIDPNIKKMKWEADIKNVMRLPPLFTQDVIYVREGEIMGRTYAIDRVNGATLWKTDQKNIISNIAYSQQKEEIYVLTQDGVLLSIDKNSGATSILVKFSKSPFILNGDEPYIGGYEVAYDENTNMLFVTLGDSRQLFAFQEK